MNALVHRFVRIASGPLLWINLGIVLAAKVLVPAAGIGLAAIVAQVTSFDAAQVISLSNQERAAAGAGTLIRDARLDAAAQAKLQDMADYNYFAHVSPGNRQPWEFILSAGYRYQAAGENLAKGFKDAPSLVSAWMGSAAHRANIVNPAYRNIGVAVGRLTVDGRESTVVVQMFAAPSAGAAAKPVATKTPVPTSVARAAAASPPPVVQGVSTDRNIAGARLTEVPQSASGIGAHTTATASGLTGAYLSLVFALLSAAFIVTGPRRHAVIAWAGHAFAIALLTALPTLALPVAHIF